MEGAGELPAPLASVLALEALQFYLIFSKEFFQLQRSVILINVKWALLISVFGAFCCFTRYLD